MQRKRYLKKLSLEKAQEIFISHPNAVPYNKSEVIKTENSLNRITEEPVFARLSSPHYHCSAMDGVAVRAEDTFSASTATPVRLNSERFHIVDTGDPIPSDLNAVIMIEDVKIDNNTIEINSAATPWQHVRMAGEDIVATELVLTRCHRIRPIDMAAMLSAGVSEVIVKKKPLVAIIPTGDEIVEPGIEPGLGNIIDSNSYMLAAMVKEWDGEPRRLGIVKDDYEQIKNVILGAADESDIILTSAGSSAGREDFIPPVIEEIGELLVHGVSISPGKPTALGFVRGKPIIGLPGYPVSMAIAAESFLKPLLCGMLNIPVTGHRKVSASVPRKFSSKLGDEEFIRVKLIPEYSSPSDREKNFIAFPLAKGASMLNSMVRADGILRIPANTEGIMPGEKIDVEIIKSLEDIQNSIVVIGSHDITLDILADEIKISHPWLTLSSAHVGSLGGLMALKRNEAHIAGTHLLDEETGEYNVSYIKKLLPDRNIKLVNLAYRQQGLIVEKGNPKGIKNLLDITEKSFTFCNRQKGSGTRILLDYQLKNLCISSEHIAGYDREVYTHTGVASAVATGMADAGMGILAAAKALNLDFIPIVEERYDLAIPELHSSNLNAIGIIMEIINSDSFRNRVQALGGYDTRDMGKLMLQESV